MSILACFSQAANVLLNHLNKVTTNYNVFAGCSEISIIVIVEHVQNIRIIMAFCLPGTCYVFQGLQGQKNCWYVVCYKGSILKLALS